MRGSYLGGKKRGGERERGKKGISGRLKRVLNKAKLVCKGRIDKRLVGNEG